MATRTLKYTFTVECVDSGEDIDLVRVEEMIDLAMQDLTWDDEFIAALDERSAVTIQVTPGITT
jgi:hypothetical protein